MKRTREELVAAVQEAQRVKDEAEQVEKAARKAYDAAVHALANHPSEQEKREAERLDVLRGKLPDFLFSLLVTKAGKEEALNYMYFGSTCDWAGNDPCNVFEITVRFGDKRSHVDFPYWDDKIDKTSVEDEPVVLVPFNRDVKQAWKQALKANEDSKGYALISLIIAAVIHTKDVDPLSTLLRDVYDQ